STFPSARFEGRKICCAVCGWNHNLAVNDGRAGSDVPGIVGNLSESRGPIAAATGENVDRLVRQVNLDAIAVEFMDSDRRTALCRSTSPARARRSPGRAPSRRLPPASYAETLQRPPVGQ